jgi:hypothetical protein
MPSLTPEMREAIERAAKEAGINPSYALAVAERESSFNPSARSSSTIHGLFQMTGGARNQYGVGNSTDPYTQAKGWAGFQRDVSREMAGPLGRQPTEAEQYLGHHFGGVRAGRMLRMDPDTPVSAVFTPRELRENPHIVKAGTVGNLNQTTVADIERRQAKYGGELPERYETAAVSPPTAAATGASAAIGSPSAGAPGATLGQETDYAASAAPQTAASGAGQTINAVGKAVQDWAKAKDAASSAPLEHQKLPTAPMPQVKIQGLPGMPQAPAPAMPTPDPMAAMLGQMTSNQQAPQQEQDFSLMGIPV